MTNEEYLHDLMEKEINPKYLRNSQMHQKISLLFALVEFAAYGREYMSHMLHCSEYLGARLRGYGWNVGEAGGKISRTHQIFIFCGKETMDTIYENAYKCGVTLNKKHKELFHGYGIRLGTQEIARYGWNNSALDLTAEILSHLTEKDIDTVAVREMMNRLPAKKVHYTFGSDVTERFRRLMMR